MGTQGHRLIGLIAAGLAGPSARGQAFNLDIGPSGSPVPSVGYGGVASQPGFWNLCDSGGKPLTDATGVVTTCELSFPSNQVASQPIDGIDPGDKELMESYLFGDRGGITQLSLTNLAPGEYTVFVYAWSGPNTPNPDRSVITVIEYTSGAFQTVETHFDNIWHGQADGVTYAKVNFQVIAPNGALGFRLESIGGGEDTPVSVLNGIQIVPIPGPGSGALSFAGAWCLAVRRRR